MARTRTVWGWLATLAVIGAGGYWLGSARGASTAPGREATRTAPSRSEPSRSEATDGAQSNEAIRNLANRLALIEARAAHSGSPAAATAPATEPAFAGEPAAPTEAELADRRAARMTAIEAALQMEQRDLGWAPATESHVHTAVRAATEDGAKFSIRTLKCLTSICEMVLSVPSADEFSHVTQELANRIKGMGSLDLAPPEAAPDGSATVTCRLFREGYPRPDEGLM